MRVLSAQTFEELFKRIGYRTFHTKVVPTNMDVDARTNPCSAIFSPKKSALLRAFFQSPDSFSFINAADVSEGFSNIGK